VPPLPFRTHRTADSAENDGAEQDTTSPRGPVWDGDPDLPSHRSSHRGLVRPVPPARADPAHRVGAIVVPTSRTFDRSGNGVRLAAELAAAHRCPLVILCSGAAGPGSFPEELFASCTRGVAVVDLSAGQGLLPRFTTSRRLLSTALRSGRDLGEKRNLGLLLAARAGWRTLLFLDDDVRPCPAHGRGPDGRVRTLDADQLAGAVGHLLREERTGAVGWILTDFDDNSVVCHARRALGMPQDQFIGGGALLVEITEDLPFFPRIYNEDWLFMFELMWRRGERGELAEGGKVLQDAYDPFVPERARFEELGDILAEGLFSLLHGRPDRAEPERFMKDDSYWQGVLARRAAMTARMRELIDTAPGLPPEARDRMTVAIEAGEEIRSCIRPGSFVDYLQAWSQDLGTWHRCLARAASSPVYEDLVLDGRTRWSNGGSPERFGWVGRR